MCTANTKTKASNGIRDGFMKTFQQNLPIAKLIESATQVESEEYNILKSLPRLKPFDLSIRLDHSIDTSAWQTHSSRIGFDVTLIHSTIPYVCTSSKAAQYTESALRALERRGENRSLQGEMVKPTNNKTYPLS